MSWWRRNWRWLLAMGLTVLTGIMVPVLLLIRKKREADELRTQLALGRTIAKVSGLEADKRARSLELATNKAAAQKLDAQIVEAQRAAVAVVRHVDNLSDEGIAAEFRRLGY